MARLLPLLALAACGVEAPTECPRTDIDLLSELDGLRRHGCLDPAALPSWAAVSRIEDAATLSELVTPFDVGEGRWLKFVLERTAEPRWTYFMNGAVFGPHWELTRAIGCESDVHERRVLGEVGYFADRLDETGTPGRFYFSIDGEPDYDEVLDTWQVLRERIPFAAGLTYVSEEDDDFDSAPFETERSTSSNPDEAIAVLNGGVAFGFLRRMRSGEVPGPTDLPVYSSLPNDLPIVAGVITTAPQTGLAHVNLRAVQDGVPNVYVPPALASSRVDPWIDRWVRLEVSALMFDVREATQREVEQHFADRRPRQRRRPTLDASLQTIEPFSAIGFGDAPAFGVKSSNLAELHRVGLEAFVPDGVAVPLGFYTRFMEETGLDDFVDDMLDDLRFRTERDDRREQLAELRARIEHATMPPELYDVLEDVQSRWPSDVSLRCRSSTNAEDLPDFNGAGLYASYTHRPDEGHLRKSVQQVYASLWSDRAFDQRDFHRIDHRHVAMGVAIHPSFEDERVSGVAVTDDVLYQWREGLYYVNAQLGDGLVTNPEPGAVPEELYLTPSNPSSPYFSIRNSSLSDDPLMSDDQLTMLSRDLGRIHAHFAALYASDGPFAMEIELEITARGELAIKQARPWVYGERRRCR